MGENKQHVRNQKPVDDVATKYLVAAFSPCRRDLLCIETRGHTCMVYAVHDGSQHVEFSPPDIDVTSNRWRHGIRINR